MIAISTYIMFQIYGTADIQPWNYQKSRNTDEEASKMLPPVTTPTVVSTDNED